MDAHIVSMYLNGEPIHATRLFFYGIRWRFSLSNLSLKFSHASLKGFLKLEPSNVEDPESWEAVLLAAEAALVSPSVPASPIERGQLCCALLTAFDGYLRSGTAVLMLKKELRAPLSLSRGTSRRWTLTMFPETEAARSTTGTQDHTIIVGGSHKEREWLTKVCVHSKRLSTNGHLLDMTQARYHFLYTKAFEAAGLPPSHPHMLRHGGASTYGRHGGRQQYGLGHHAEGQLGDAVERRTVPQASQLPTSIGTTYGSAACVCSHNADANSCEARACDSLEVARQEPHSLFRSADGALHRIRRVKMMMVTIVVMMSLLFLMCLI